MIHPTSARTIAPSGTNLPRDFGQTKQT